MVCPWGGTRSTNMQGGAAGKAAKLLCPRATFLKMIPYLGAKFSCEQFPILKFLQTNLCSPGNL